MNVTQPPAEQEAIAFLGNPRNHGGAVVARIDTHAAIVFLVGDRAFKLKRAVRYPYLDYGTLERRRAACVAEVAINRRTAPSLYLGVQAVVRGSEGDLCLSALSDDGAGFGAEAVDWVVTMRRFPDDALFDRLAERHALTLPILRALAERIATFHAAAAPRPDGGGAEGMRAVVVGNLDDLRGASTVFPAATVARLADDSTAAITRLAGLLEARRRGGFVRHCHGDLHLRNIVLLDGIPTLFDAIEFDEALAVTDVLYDLAFLLMDLDHRGLRPLGNAVLNRWVEVSGDAEGLAALPLFLSARAAVRAKVLAAALRVANAPPDVAAEARGYLDHAVAALEPPPARLVVIGGLSGSGKSVLAAALAPSLGACPGALVLRSDALRKSLFGVADTARLPSDAYTPAAITRVYHGLMERARAALTAGHAVVIDAVCARPSERAAFESLAADLGLRFDGVWLDAPLERRVERVANRRNDASDATVEVAKAQERYDLGPMAWARLDAGRVASDVLAEALERLL